MGKAKAYLGKKRRLKPCLKLETKEEDRISELPDMILHQILGLLVTKEAVKTSILSKRWKLLWTGMPILDFGEESRVPLSSNVSVPLIPDDWKRSRSFSNFINNFFFNHQENAPIFKFCLYCDGYFEIGRLHSWLSYLVRHKIQHLHLVSHEYRKIVDFTFPCSLFTCDSLMVLKLEMRSRFKLPTFTRISFTVLHTLSLKYVSLSNDFNQLFPNCPVLEYLYLFKCKWVDINTINISSPTLKTVSIDDALSLLDLLTDHPSYSGVGNSEIKICAPNINRLVLSGYLPKGFDLCDLKFLPHASIKLYMKHKGEEENLQLAIKFLRQLSNVQVLEIGGSITQAFFLEENFLPHLPSYKKLNSLTLKWDYVIVASGTLLNILQMVPNLASLYICMGKSKHVVVHHDHSAPTALPHSLLLSLKHIEITMVGTLDFDMDTIEFFLKYAKVFEQMIITTSRGLGAIMQEEVDKLAEKIPRCSQRGYIHVKES